MSGTFFRPIKVVSIDLGKPLSPIDLTRPGDLPYGGIFCLVRSGAQPLMILELEHSGPVVEPEDLLLAVGSLHPLPQVIGHRSHPVEKVAVVIATRDRADSLDRCLASLFDQTRAPDEVVVVDNAPASAATANLLAAQYGGRVRYALEPTPGLGRAHNTGLRHVTSDIVLFTDDDVVLDKHWVAAMAAPMEEDATVGCVTGLILPAELETRAQVWTERHGGFGKGLHRRTYDLQANRPKSTLFPFTAGQFGSGANMAFRAGALRRVGEFDAALGAGTPARGGDDLSAFFSILSGGYRLVYQPQGIVWHHHRRGEEGMRRQAYCYGMGLGAFLTKIVVDEPRRVFRLAAVFSGRHPSHGGAGLEKDGAPAIRLSAATHLDGATGHSGRRARLSAQPRQAPARRPTTWRPRQQATGRKGGLIMQPIPILLYHSIGEACSPDYRRWLVTPQEFDAQMRKLAERGYVPITVRDLALLRLGGKPVPPHTCVITFDDGLRDFAEGAVPILTAHGFPATLFVVSGLVGATASWLADLGEGDRPMLDWQALRELEGLGIEVGAHTVSHLELDTLSRARATREIRDSKQSLEDGLGQAVTTFAYPHGYASRVTRRIVEDVGYLAACRVRHALSNETEDLYALSRIIVTSDLGPDGLIELMEGPKLPVAPATDRIIAMGWRAARRVRALRRSVTRPRRAAQLEGGE